MVANCDYPEEVIENRGLFVVCQMLLFFEMPQEQVSVIFTNIDKVNYLMLITDFLKVNMIIETI